MAPGYGGKPVEIRAFRGTRQSSVYREHVLPGEVYARILAAGAKRGFPLLSALDRIGPHDLDRRKAQQLADETGSLRRSGDLLELDGDLTAVAEVARWCARAPGRAWLRIEAR